MRITFLVRNIWGIGGTIKTTFNTAAALIDRGHDVTIASCVRAKDETDFDHDPRIKIVSLWDVRDPSEGGDRLSLADRINTRLPSVLDPLEINRMRESSRLLDKRIKRFLRRFDTDVLVSTHVILNLLVARFARPGTVAVAQEHLYLDHYRGPVQDEIKRRYGAFDAIVTVTEADARVYREAMPDHADKVECIPNSIPANPAGRSPLTEPVIMTAGRLTGMKGFDILIRAFGEVAHHYPDWSVKIYGRGRDRKKLQKLIDEHGLRGRVKLMGPVAPLDEEWHRASIAAVPSRFEPFGLVIVEAMAAGMPVVCTRVKHGPLEIVEDGRNGLLVKSKDPEELGKALRRLIEDEDLRRELAEGAAGTARTFEPAQVVGLHEALFERLVRR
ncbi:glycosyltransferase family 4 protein [Glycomyces salinus]|uniref:glycosyltransferase family 4 protein n=1 Tax=Glycomyces salinus TaxID=980294 RepID=UPI0018EA54AC|nr:glycosyltransferase family 4 protein [Glycomyces salinus]